MAGKTVEIPMDSIEPVNEEPVLLCLDQGSENAECDVPSEAPSVVDQHPCQSLLDVSQCLQGIANHVQSNKSSHEEECFSIQNFDDNVQEIQSIVQSIDIIRTYIEDNKKTDDGKQLNPILSHSSSENQAIVM